MKLFDVIQARKIFGNYANDKLTVSLAYKMMRFIKVSDNDENFYNEKVREIINQYAKRDDQGNFVPHTALWVC